MCNEVILKNADKGYNDASEFRCLIEPEGVVVTRVFRSQYSTKILIAPRLSGFNGSGCQSKGVYNVTAIGEGAFAGCDYKEIRIIGGCYDKAGNLDNDGNMYGPQEIRSKAFANCQNLTRIELPHFLEKIQSLAFAGCSSLLDITIPDDVTDIYDGAFKNCTALKTVHLPDALTKVMPDLFRGCSSIQEIKIPDKVSSIGDGAFADCTRLSQITIPNSVTEISANAFDGCPKLTICGKRGSCALRYANQHRIPFLDDPLS